MSHTSEPPVQELLHTVQLTLAGSLLVDSISLLELLLVLACFCLLLAVALKEEVDLAGALLLDALSLADLVATLSGCCIRLESGNLYSVQLSHRIVSPLIRARFMVTGTITASFTERHIS